MPYILTVKYKLHGFFCIFQTKFFQVIYIPKNLVLNKKMFHPSQILLIPPLRLIQPYPIFQTFQSHKLGLFIPPFIYYTADVSRNANYGHNHYPLSFFKSFIQALHAYRAKGKVGNTKMAEHSFCSIPYFGMCLLLPCAYFSKM